MAVKSYRLLVVSAGALVTLKALQWWRGYSVDVAGGLGPLLPVVYRVIAVIPALVAIIAIIRTMRGAGLRASRLTLFWGSLLVLGLQWTVPSFMMLGFKSRMSQFGASEFQALADSMRSAVGPNHRGDLLMEPTVAKSLTGAHPLLRVSPERPKGYVGAQQVQVRWGSGLTGAFAVDIWNGETEPPVSADAVDPTPLYPNVRLVWIF